MDIGRPDFGYKTTARIADETVRESQSYEQNNRGGKGSLPEYPHSVQDGNQDAHLSSSVHTSRLGPSRREQIWDKNGGDDGEGKDTDESTTDLDRTSRLFPFSWTLSFRARALESGARDLRSFLLLHLVVEFCHTNSIPILIVSALVHNAVGASVSFSAPYSSPPSSLPPSSSLDTDTSADRLHSPDESEPGWTYHSEEESQSRPHLHLRSRQHPVRTHPMPRAPTPNHIEYLSYLATLHTVHLLYFVYSLLTSSHSGSGRLHGFILLDFLGTTDLRSLKPRLPSRLPFSFAILFAPETVAYITFSVLAICLHPLYVTLLRQIEHLKWQIESQRKQGRLGDNGSFDAAGVRTSTVEAGRSLNSSSGITTTTSASIMLDPFEKIEMVQTSIFPLPSGQTLTSSREVRTMEQQRGRASTNEESVGASCPYSSRPSFQPTRFLYTVSGTDPILTVRVIFPPLTNSTPPSSSPSLSSPYPTSSWFGERWLRRLRWKRTVQKIKRDKGKETVPCREQALQQQQQQFGERRLYQPRQQGQPGRQQNNQLRRPGIRMGSFAVNSA